MFYKFNGITQRLSTSPQDASMGRPVSAESFTKSLKEEPKILYEFKPAQVNSNRPASHAVASLGPGQYGIPNSAKYKKLMEMQSKFLASDGKLVWQKLPKDLPLYYLSVGLVVVGTVLTSYTLAKLASPPQNE